MARNDLVSEWGSRGIKEGQEYAILTKRNPEGDVRARCRGP